MHPKQTEERRLPWFKMFALDFLARNADLSLAEKGALVTLMCHWWIARTIPDDKAAMRITGATPAQWKKMRDVVLNRLQSAELPEQAREAEASYEKRAEAGRKGGHQKYNNAVRLTMVS
jgi:uncharacterized protein YdaU (DUF1376 family)